MAGEGADVPDLDDRPEIAAHLDFEWSAFFALSTDRAVGFGIGRIPWTSIDRYAARAGIEDPDEFARFQRIIMAMDGAFIEDVVAKQERDK